MPLTFTANPSETMCVHNQFMVCLVRVQYPRPLITQSILIQSASFSHDCHAPLPPWQQKRERPEEEGKESKSKMFPHLPPAFEQMISSESALSEQHLVNLALILPCLYH